MVKVITHIFKEYTFDMHK